MARFTSQYKQQSVTRRVVSGENTYEKGMYWSDQALASGYVHTLLNLEINQLSGSLTVAGGLHTLDAAPGCSFLENVSFGDNSHQVVVLQGRNEYCLRAFEGLTNIISVNKLSVKDNQTLAEKLRQQGFAPNDVECYKILTHNPINNRLMSITLIKASRDRYFTINENFQLRRLTANPISCGLSEVWEGGYVSNKMDYHPNGVEDYYVPRVRRNRLNETFGQLLHSPHHMQSFAHCEGYGNKTFMFTKKRVVDIEGERRDLTEIPFLSRYRATNITLNQTIFNGLFRAAVGGLPNIGDVLMLFTNTGDDSDTIRPARWVVTNHNNNPTNPVIDLSWIDRGEFKNHVPFPGIQIATNWQFRYLTRTFNHVFTSGNAVWQQFEVQDPSFGAGNFVNDIYFNGINIGYTGSFNPEFISSTFNNIPVPIDAYRFGRVLTSCGIRFSGNTTPSPLTLPENNPAQLLDTAIADHIRAMGTISGAIPAIELNLDTGEIRPTIIQSTTESITLDILPVLERGGLNPVNNFSPTDIFQTIKIDNWGASNAWIQPWNWLTENIKIIKRKGQGFRIAAYCRSNPTTLTRYLNTLHGDPLESDYYIKPVDTVFVLDYVWNGLTWEFSFVDTAVEPSPTLVENWDMNGLDNFNNIITRHFIYSNVLSYTDVITEKNEQDLAKHIVDDFMAPKMVFEQIKDASDPSFPGILHSTLTQPLTYNRTETLDDIMVDADLAFANRSKMFDVAYGHFEAEPKSLRPSEAARWGYNMLSSNPYNFECTNTPGQSPNLTGVLLVQDSGLPLLRPILNTPGVLRIFYDADLADISHDITNDTQKYVMKVEHRDPYSDWRPLLDLNAVETHERLVLGTPIEVPFIGVDETIIIRVTIWNSDVKTQVIIDGNEEDVLLTTSRMETTLNYTKDARQHNIEPEVFDLGTCTGMTYWKGRLVCWGVLNAPQMLFLSEPNNPDYFAYPNGVDIFEETIMHVLPYSDALIVFTSTKMWRVDMGSDGLSWTKTLLQQNIRITDKDIPYIIVLKNMLFFKSDKLFYMLVPARSGTVGELTIAPISKAIANFLKEPFKNIENIVKVPYPDFKKCARSISEYLIKYGAHTEQNRVFIDWWFDLTDWKAQAPRIRERQMQHEVVDEQLTPKEYWLVQLIYDAETYGWSLRTHTTNTLGVFVTDAVNTDTEFLNLQFTPEWEYTYKKENTSTPFRIGEDSYNRPTWGINISQRRTTDDKLIKQMTLSAEQLKHMEPTYPRFQTFDTGYKEVSTPALKKRFREIQIMLQPLASTEVNAEAPDDFLTQLITNDIPNVAEEPELIMPYMTSMPVPRATGDAVALKALLEVFVDGNKVISATRPQITYTEPVAGVMDIRITEVFNFITTGFPMDAELSNTFLLDQSAFKSVRLVRFRKALSGKGNLARMRFMNLTESNYAIVGHSFVAHNRNAR